jgi:hypothetical protein
MVYKLDFINSIREETLSNTKLSDVVIDIIKNLSDKVLSPNYSKTPVFTKKKYNNSFVNYNKFVQQPSTKIIKNKNIVNDIKCLLNKLSNKTLKEVSQKITTHLGSCSSEDKPKIISLLFDVKTSSIMFVKLYSDLLKKIVISNALIKPFIIQTVNEINNSIIEELKTVEDYDDLCKNNENLENKSAQYILITYLFKSNIIDKEFILSLLLNLEKNIIKNVENSDGKDLIDYYVKNICRVLNILNETMLIEEDLETHNNYLLNILSMCSNKTKNKGLSNKTGFNIMDYCDENGLEY